MPAMTVQANVAPAKRVFNYDAFVDELRELITRGDGIVLVEDHHEAQNFRAWCREVINLISRIKKLKYPVDCGISGRMFGAHQHYSTKEERSTQFTVDLKDTLSELKLIVRMYEKYGDPKEDGIAHAEELPVVQAREAYGVTLGGIAIRTVDLPSEVPQKPVALEPPSKVTLKWLWEHVPAPALFGVPAGFFAAGVTCASWTPVQAWIIRVLS